jgi:pseudouridylate synthase
MEIDEEVRSTLELGSPVVALESTVIAHGLPAPRNLEVGAELEALVRAGGAVPATIAVLDGRARVGLSVGQMERIGTEGDVLKLSTRDLPLALARGGSGATTVAATSWLANRAGIAVFATGGIGGVHRGEPRDVSADLVELGRTPTLVVCAGAKSILDLPATREALESAGVLCLGWKTKRFPAFYSGESGLEVDAEVGDEADVAAIWRAARKAGLPGGMLLCVPPPREAELPRALIEAAIDRALDEARTSGVSGRAVTPFLLAAVARETGGRALTANIALLRRNASIAARVAVSLASA